MRFGKIAKITFICVISLSIVGSSVGLIETKKTKKKKKRVRKMKVESAAFKNGQKIPVKYTGDGEDISPPISWSNVPDGTVEFALICDDPDAPTPKPWVHWVIYKIPADVRALPENLPKLAILETPIKAYQGRNSWTRVGYNGPAPPPGSIHHYHFTVYALDTALDIKETANKEQLLSAMEGHIIGKGSIVGTYKR